MSCGLTGWPKRRDCSPAAAMSAALRAAMGSRGDEVDITSARQPGNVIQSDPGSEGVVLRERVHDCRLLSFKKIEQVLGHFSINVYQDPRGLVLVKDNPLSRNTVSDGQPQLHFVCK